MKVQVMSRKKFEEYGWQPHRETSIVISISSCGDSAPFVIGNNTNRILNILNLFFNDTDDRNPAFGAMTTNDAMHIVKFLKLNLNTAVDKVIVHCDAGQSRSAGVAAAILKYYTNDDTQIFDNPRYKPNMLCYRQTLEALHYSNI